MLADLPRPLSRFVVPKGSTTRIRALPGPKRTTFFVDELFKNMFKQNQCALNGLGDSNQPEIC